MAQESLLFFEYESLDLALFFFFTNFTYFTQHAPSGGDLKAVMMTAMQFMSKLNFALHDIAYALTHQRQILHYLAPNKKQIWLIQARGLSALFDVARHLPVLLPSLKSPTVDFDEYSSSMDSDNKQITLVIIAKDICF